MVNKLNYFLKTLTYFNPETKNHVTIKDLQKIVSGKVINPYKLRNSNSTTDYTYFIISNQGIDELKSFKERKFESYYADEICNKSNWFGKFTINYKSSIVQPFSKVFEFDSTHFNSFSIDKSIWSYGGGFFQLDKNIGNKVLTTDLSLDQILVLLEK